VRGCLKEGAPHGKGLQRDSEPEGHIRASSSVHTIRRQKNHLVIKYFALFFVGMLQEIRCAKLL